MELSVCPSGKRVTCSRMSLGRRIATHERTRLTATALDALEPMLANCQVKGAGWESLLRASRCLTDMASLLGPF